MARASDDTREETVAVLRDGLITGRLGMETFVERIDDAYDAKTHDELALLRADLPSSPSWWGRLRRRIGGADEALDQDAATCLRPPTEARVGTTLTIGRASACDYQVPDSTVSASHAELRCDAEGWVIRDCGSLNGSRVNGWRVAERRLADGDEIALGAARLIFREPRA